MTCSTPSLRHGLAQALLTAALLGSLPARAETPAPPDETAANPEEAAPSPAASEMLKSMREKGILSEGEYEDLYRRQARFEHEQREASQLPGWMQGWTFGGDLRFRYDHQDFGGSFAPLDTLIPGEDNVDAQGSSGRAVNVRNRGRFRVRLGAEKRIASGMVAGVRLATSQQTSFGEDSGGGVADLSTRLQSDPRSPNADAGDYFAPKGIFLDRAYLDWTPSFAETLKLSIGKMANPFVSRDWSADFLVWDHDLNPEGIAAQYHFDLITDSLWLDTSAGIFMVDEQGSATVVLNGAGTGYVTSLPDPDTSDPYLAGYQLGLTGRPLDWMRAGVRASFYDFEDLNTRFAAAISDLGNGGETIDENPLFILFPGAPFAEPSGAADGNIQELVLDAFVELTPFGERWKITPFFQHTQILSAANEDEGFGVGFDLGTPDFLKLTVMYARIQRNGVVSLFTDSDLFDGFTNAKGWYVALERRLTPAVKLRGAFFKSRIAKQNCVAFLEDGTSAFCDDGFAEFPDFFRDFRKTSLDRFRVQVDLTVDF